MGPRWPGHYFYQFEKRLPQTEIKCTRWINLEIRFNLALCFIRSSIFYRKTSFWVNFNSFLDIILSTMIHADSVSFLTSADDRIQKYSSMFGFPWTNPSVNSQWYVKQWVLWYGLGSIITILVCKLNSTRFVLSIPDTLLTLCFTCVSCDMQIS